jgi:hypothetical protein
VRLAADVVDDAVQLARPARAGARTSPSGPPAVVVEAELPSASHRAIEYGYD